MNRTASHKFIKAITFAVCCITTAFVQAADAKTDRPEPTPEDRKALVVVCRASALKGAAWGHNYYIDGLHVAKLSSGAYTQISIPARELVVSTGPKRNPLFRKAKINAEVGHTYYVIDNPGNSFASYETLTATNTDSCIRRSKAYQSPTVGNIE
jgi:hypothetical protein